jgi:hypothetical protein
MPNPIPVTPATVPAIGDPGDDTARRYRYQWTYAAIICCMLLDETQGIDEVFCEHHEDVLPKHTDGSFSGYQIKTKESDQSLWKAKDPAVRKSCIRFAKLESDYPGAFRAFRFLTNHPLYVAKNGQDFGHLLEQIKLAKTVEDLFGESKKYVKGIAKDAKVSEETVFEALSKTTADDQLPKLRDAENNLANTIPDVWDGARDASIPMARLLAGNLIDACTRASSLSHLGTLPAYIAAMDDPIKTELRERIEGKRITAAKVLEIFKRGMKTTAILEGDLDKIQVGVGDESLLVKKLDAGGFSAVSINSAKDLRDKADYLGIKWTKIHGNENGLQRYSHIRSTVLADAADSLETVKNRDEPFGPAMLTKLRSRIRSRRAAAGSQLFDCSDEHLEGFAYSLTSECKVVWSNSRPWEDE